MASTSPPSTLSSIRVGVRARPLTDREKDKDEQRQKFSVRMEGNKAVVLSGRSSRGVGVGASAAPVSASLASLAAQAQQDEKTFFFDHCFWSVEEDAVVDSDADQRRVYDALGRQVLDAALDGYNSCLMAYGQTGAGKSHSVMGTAAAPGIIPRLCADLFDYCASRGSPGVNGSDDAGSISSGKRISHVVEVGYLEIYNERVRDLLASGRGDVKDGVSVTGSGLRVREHPVTGPFVEGLTKIAVSSFADVEALLDIGNSSRVVAATRMNETSSRSHAIFTISFAETIFGDDIGAASEKTSKLHLVDLAGSERASVSGLSGIRLVEGGNINKSLTTLGLVISALATASTEKKQPFVPYRDSVLTWLLKDSLGGNSKTVLLAAISPSVDSYEETTSTLRFASRAKRVLNNAVINEDPNLKLIRELRQEVANLQSQLQVLTAQSGVRSPLTPTGPSIDPRNSLSPSTPSYSRQNSEDMSSMTSSADGTTMDVDALRMRLESSRKIVDDLSADWHESRRLRLLAAGSSGFTTPVGRGTLPSSTASRGASKQRVSRGAVPSQSSNGRATDAKGNDRRRESNVGVTCASSPIEAAEGPESILVGRVDRMDGGAIASGVGYYDEDIGEFSGAPGDAIAPDAMPESPSGAAPLSRGGSRVIRFGTSGAQLAWLSCDVSMSGVVVFPLAAGSVLAIGLSGQQRHLGMSLDAAGGSGDGGGGSGGTEEDMDEELFDVCVGVSTSASPRQLVSIEMSPDGRHATLVASPGVLCTVASRGMVSGSCALSQGDVIMVDGAHVFRYSNPDHVSNPTAPIASLADSPDSPVDVSGATVASSAIASSLELSAIAAALAQKHINDAQQTHGSQEVVVSTATLLRPAGVASGDGLSADAPSNATALHENVDSKAIGLGLGLGLGLNEEVVCACSESERSAQPHVSHCRDERCAEDVRCANSAADVTSIQPTPRTLESDSDSDDDNDSVYEEAVAEPMPGAPTKQSYGQDGVNNAHLGDACDNKEHTVAGDDSLHPSIAQMTQTHAPVDGGVSGQTTHDGGVGADAYMTRGGEGEETPGLAGLAPDVMVAGEAAALFEGGALDVTNDRNSVAAIDGVSPPTSAAPSVEVVSVSASVRAEDREKGDANAVLAAHIVHTASVAAWTDDNVAEEDERRREYRDDDRGATPSTGTLGDDSVSSISLSDSRAVLDRLIAHSAIFDTALPDTALTDAVLTHTTALSQAAPWANTNAQSAPLRASRLVVDDINYLPNDVVSSPSRVPLTSSDGHQSTRMDMASHVTSHVTFDATTTSVRNGDFRATTNAAGDYTPDMSRDPVGGATKKRAPSTIGNLEREISIVYDRLRMASTYTDHAPLVQKVVANGYTQGGSGSAPLSPQQPRSPSTPDSQSFGGVRPLSSGSASESRGESPAVQSVAPSVVSADTAATTRPLRGFSSPRDLSSLIAGAMDTRIADGTLGADTLSRLDALVLRFERGAVEPTQIDAVVHEIVELRLKAMLEEEAARARSAAARSQREGILVPTAHAANAGPDSPTTDVHNAGVVVSSAGPSSPQTPPITSRPSSRPTSRPSSRPSSPLATAHPPQTSSSTEAPSRALRPSSPLRRPMVLDGPSGSASSTGAPPYSPSAGAGHSALARRGSEGTADDSPPQSPGAGDAALSTPSIQSPMFAQENPPAWALSQLASQDDAAQSSMYVSITIPTVAGFVSPAGDRYNAFAVRVRCLDGEWVTWRRYSHFEFLKGAVTSKYPDIASSANPVFPPKKRASALFSFGSANQSAEFLDSRRQRLETYLAMVVACLVRRPPLSEGVNARRLIQVVPFLVDPSTKFVRTLPS